MPGWKIKHPFSPRKKDFNSEEEWRSAYNSWHNKSFKRNRNKYTKKRWSNPIIKNNVLKNLYGITLKQRDEMAQKQNGRCAICGNADKLTVDHNHGTGKVRELLCGNCNRALGLVKENPNTVQAMKDYILRHNE